jgi:hypothetical protein
VEDVGKGAIVQMSRHLTFVMSGNSRSIISGRVSFAFDNGLFIYRNCKKVSN